MAGDDDRDRVRAVGGAHGARGAGGRQRLRDRAVAGGLPGRNRLERDPDALLERRTAVVIAHRLATVERCDEIAIVEDGRIVEHGRRETLAADPDSRFHRLLRVGLEQVLA